MFDAIYQVELDGSRFQSYCDAWKVVANYMMTQRFAVSSTIYSSADHNLAVIHSRWPTSEMCSKSWPLKDDAPDDVKRAAEVMREVAQSKKNLTMTMSEFIAYVNVSRLKRRDGIISPRKNILVYNDNGCCESTYEIFDALKAVVDLQFCRVLSVDASYFNEITDWEQKTRIVIIPGDEHDPITPT